MKNKFTLLCIIALGITINISAQNCGTIIPEGFLKSNDSKIKSAGIESLIPHATLPNVNLSLTVYVSNNWLTMSNISHIIDSLNVAFQPTGISFTVCEIVNIKKEGYMIILDKEKEEEMRTRYNAPGTINIYVTNRLLSDNKVVCGYAYLPSSSSPDCIFLDINCNLTSTLIHEMGHFFGLLHPHETAGGDELVDGSNCDVAGDLICDTEASPNLLEKVNSNCVYTGNSFDENFEHYLPTVTNHMSYSPPKCRCRFTEDQYERMVQYYWSHRTHLR